jgi:DNA-binding FrmR family transcriptional regulator
MDDRQKKLVRRLKIAEGQVRGLQQMIANGDYCVDVIAQASAVRQAISGVEDALMEAHLRHCVVAQVRQGKEEKATAEILKVYKLKGK